MRHISLLTALLLSAQATEQTQLEPIHVHSSVPTILIDDVYQNAPKSADLADALHKATPSINMIRRSGIANDIVLRGQKRDNINVLIDGAKIYGACPNRMDPPTSHVITTTVQSVEVQEGPFDVEHSGSLSGLVNIITHKPAKDITGEVGANIGSFDYYKAYAHTSGYISDTIGMVLSASKEIGGQYLDANGDNLATQTKNHAKLGDQYQDKYANKKAFDKTMFMGKVYWDIADNQTLKLSYMLNRSDNILYPSSGMDAIYDNSDMINANYTIKNLSTLSKALSIDAYHSYVDHPMATTYRNKAVGIGSMMNMDMTNHLQSTIQGVKLKNSLTLAKSDITVGANMSNRIWDGGYSANGTDKHKSIDDARTLNGALFVKANTPLSSQVHIDTGVRYDYNSISSPTKSNNVYNNLSGNAVAHYAPIKAIDMFVGVGHSVRVPDARELYFVSGSGTGTHLGTDTLKPVQNSEIDAGGTLHVNYMKLKGKVFYSNLTDYIYYNASKTANVFENIDAYIFGGEASIYAPIIKDTLDFDAAVAMQRGKKRQALQGQTNLNLTDISPIRANASLTYSFAPKAYVKFDTVMADKWRWYDSDNGEQALEGYMVFNIKYKQTFAKHYDIALGVDNLANSLYQLHNTSMDLTLLTSGTNTRMLLNEPGRYFYANVAYKF